MFRDAKDDSKSVSSQQRRVPSNDVQPHYGKATSKVCKDRNGLRHQRGKRDAAGQSLVMAIIAGLGTMGASYHIWAPLSAVETTQSVVELAASASSWLHCLTRLEPLRARNAMSPCFRTSLFRSSLCHPFGFVLSCSQCCRCFQIEILAIAL